MMGVQKTPARLFHDFCLDEHVPADHLSGASTVTWTLLICADR